MNRHSLTKNFVFQLTYQILITLIPFIISPYLTRVIGSKGLGIYTYSFSIAYYFVMFAMLGIMKYGQRLISEASKDDTSLRKAFWSLYSLHILVSVTAILLYIVFVTFFINEDKLIYYIQIFYVTSAVFDITWFFYGLENFKSVVVKNTVIKLLECILIFLLVKKPEDLYIYTLIVSCDLVLGQIVMIPQAVKIAKPIRFTIEDIKPHIKPMIVLSVAVVAVSLYTVFDKTLLGVLSTKENVAYYEYSNKIINVPKAIIGVVGTVTFPRACRMLDKGDFDGHKACMQDSLIITCLIGFASMFGLIAIAEPLSIFYYGADFAECGGVMKALSPVIIIVELGNILRMQYLIPKKLDKSYTFCICLNAIVNLVLSFLLIPIIGIYGAVVGTVAAESFGLIYQLTLCRDVINIAEILNVVIPFAVIGTLMFLLIRVLLFYLKYSLTSLIIVICLGGLVYILLSVIYLLLFEKEFSNKFVNKIKELL